jgi:hypothetical protein
MTFAGEDIIFDLFTNQIEFVKLQSYVKYMKEQDPNYFSNNKFNIDNPNILNFLQNNNFKIIKIPMHDKTLNKIHYNIIIVKI